MIDYKPAPNCKSDDANTAFLQTNFTVKFQRPNQTKHNKELETKASPRRQCSTGRILSRAFAAIRERC